MDLKIIQGRSECVQCEKKFDWQSQIIGGDSGSFKGVGNYASAQAYAIKRNPDGTIDYEIKCQCPFCNVYNKYYKTN